MPDSYGSDLTAVGRDDEKTWESATIISALKATNPISRRSGM
jgi:hypothetical protein